MAFGTHRVLVSGPGGLPTPSADLPLITTLVPARSDGSATPTFTRASAAYVLGYGPTAVLGVDDSVMLLCAAGEARFMGARRISEGVWSADDANGTFLSTTNGASSLCCDAYGPLGYFDENQIRINRCLYSQTWENAAWSATDITPADNTAVAPDGTSTAATLTATAANGTIIQDLGVVASASKTGAVWIKRKTGTGTINLTMDGGSAWTAVTVTSGWTRVFKTQALADEDFGIRIVTSGDAVYVWNAQVETSDTMSSDIPTTSVAVQRNADQLVYPGPGNIDVTKGTAYLEYKMPTFNVGVTIIANVELITTNSAIGGLVVDLAAAAQTISYYDGTTQLASGPTLSTGLFKVATSWGGSTGVVASNGTTASGAFAGTFTSASAGIRIGNKVTYQGHMGTIRNVRIWKQALPAATLQALTT